MAMKLLLFSDLHRDVEAAQRLVQQAAAQDVDVAVGAGDFASMRRGLNDTIDVLRELPCPCVLVAGNAETDTELQGACAGWEQAHVLHGSGAEIGGVVFFGLGGAIPVTPFGSWSFDLDEETASELLRGCPEQCVLVTHSPPLGVVDRSSTGRQLGSRAIRSVIETQQPLLSVCGHIHDQWEQTERIGRTPVVNAGPRGVIWQLAQEPSE